MPKIFGELVSPLQYEIEGQGLSVAEMAERIGVHRSTLYNAFASKRMQRSTAGKIANALGIETQAVFELLVKRRRRR